MDRLASMMAMVALLLSADSFGALRAPPPSHVVNFSTDETLPTLQGTPQSADQGKPARRDSTDNPDRPTKGQNGALQPMSRLSLVRYVDGELVHVIKAIPAGK